MAPTKPQEARKIPNRDPYELRPRKVIAVLRTGADYKAFNRDPKTIARRNQAKAQVKAAMQREKDSMAILLQGFGDLDIKRPTCTTETEPSGENAKEKMAEFQKAKLEAAREKTVVKTMLKMSGMGLRDGDRAKNKAQNERLLLQFEERYTASLEREKDGGKQLADGLVRKTKGGGMLSYDQLHSVEDAVASMRREIEQKDKENVEPRIKMWG